MQDSACEELADLLDATVFDVAEASRLLTALIERAAMAELHLVQEAALNALGSGVDAYPDVVNDEIKRNLFMSILQLISNNNFFQR